TNHSIIQSINQPINQPINQSINQSINHSTNHSIIQPINQLLVLRSKSKGGNLKKTSLLQKPHPTPVTKNIQDNSGIGLESRIILPYFAAALRKSAL
ncbi:MAG: hypothetical protein U9R32_00505, partial [Bacteroidota bacterium]|nr:hypothetical protein [Bacteroidota bacterium]